MGEITRPCPRCKGTGKQKGADKISTVTAIFNALAFNDRVNCPLCGGTGKVADKYWREKQCSECWSTFRYNVNWEKIPDLCPSCKAKKKAEAEARKAKWREKSCADCGTTIRYNIDWEKIPDLCPTCKAKKKAEAEARKAKWREKRCTKCGATIRYNVDWSNIPDYCPDCREWKKKPCSTPGCSNSVTYKIFWDNIPDLCEDCRKQKKQQNEGTHSSPYQRARREFMRQSLNDPTVPSHIKDWIRQEMRNRGENGYWRSPPGYDVGHLIPGIDDPNNFRWETADMNRSRGGKHHR